MQLARRVQGREESGDEGDKTRDFLRKGEFRCAG
jgi:hypothetical protein